MLTPIVQETRRAGADAQCIGPWQPRAPSRSAAALQQSREPRPALALSRRPPHTDLGPTDDARAQDGQTVPPPGPSLELKAQIDAFFDAVSFQSGQRPGYAKIRDLFVDNAKLIKSSSEFPEVLSVDDFIATRQSLVDSGALTSFEEIETAEVTEAFGNIAHRFSTYKKRGTMHREAIEGTGVISTQFIRTPIGWKMSSMAWDDERQGLTIPDRYR